MSTVKFANVNKIYPNNVQAVFDFNLDVKDKEFIVFVGPSGCGKSTTLRMLAGLEEISSGEVYIDGVLINTVPPKDRNIAMVFQNYALYPHMSVFDNMAFSLKLRKDEFPVFEVEETPEYKKRYEEIINKNKEETLKGIEEIKANNKKKKNAKKNIKDKIKDFKFRQETALKVQLKQLDKEFSKPVLGYDARHIKRLQNELTALESANIPDARAVEAKRQEIDTAMDSKVTQKYEYRHYSDEEIAEKVANAAEKLGLTPYLKRKPAALSGGQRQRVALGRAIVRNPKVFLMDEPLSNLDAKLRVQMRSEIAKIHKSVGATTIYVTHDQTEAMTMATRIVCMKDGYIQQIGTPKELFNNPVNMFVASFIGSPAMNFISGSFDGKNFIIEKDNKNVFTLTLKENQAKLLSKYVNKNIILGIRPEDIYLSGDKSVDEPSAPISLTCDISELLGRELIVYSFINDQRIIIKTNARDDINSGDEKKYVFDMERIHFFDIDTTEAIR